MKTCYIIDDELHAISNLQDYIEKTPGLSLTGTNQNPLQALAQFQESEVYPDITFLDIDMPHLSGIELSVSDFLLKPFSYERFLKCINKIIPILQKKKNEPSRVSEDHFYIQTDGKGKMTKLFYRDIFYIESQKNYLSIVTAQKKLLTYLTLSEIEEKLNGQPFLRIHKSYIVNTEKISHVEGNEIFLTDIKENFPIGVSYKDAFLAYMKEKLIKTKRP
jgi:DNA-binding LytR/AlgR family response regulator